MKRFFMDAKQLSECFKSLGDETRLQILNMLDKQELCACKILEKFNITQPTLSYHMKSLVYCGLVEVKKNGSWNLYSINKNTINECAKIFTSKLM